MFRPVYPTILQVTQMPELTVSIAERLPIYREVAHIHAVCINQGFLSSLGEGFLALLYEAIDADPNSALFVEYVEGKLVGFVAGGMGMGTVYWQLIKRWPWLVNSLSPVLLNPAKLKHIIEIVWFGRKQKLLSDCPKAELFSIAVLEEARGCGVAQRLYRALGENFAAEGERAFCIVVGEKLIPAHHFYQRMGAVPIGEISVHDGQSSTLYRHDLRLFN